MANELTYQSEFTGQQMDAKFTAVGELTAALEALTAVVAQKYVKPVDGIPATDMDADVQAALAKALTAVQSLADYYTKAEVDALLAAINAQEYVDVSSLPTASASTMGKIYLVGPDGSGYYSYYISSYDGSAYSWVGPLGTTEISLANYATKAELNQLSQEVDELQDAMDGKVTVETDITSSFSLWADDRYIGANPSNTITFGSAAVDSTNTFKATSQVVDISAYAGKKLKMAFAKRSNAQGEQTNFGCVFYSSDNTPLEGIRFPAASTASTVEFYEIEVTIDATWKKLKTTYFKDEQTYGAFYAKIVEVVEKGTLQEQIDALKDLPEDVADLDESINGVGKDREIGTINANLTSYQKLFDISIPQGTVFKVRITGAGDIARFMLLANASSTIGDVLQDYCQFGIWYEVTAAHAISSVGYQTGDNPNATNVFFELLLVEGIKYKTEKNTADIERLMDAGNTAKLTSKLYLTDKRIDLFYSPLFKNWNKLNTRYCRVSATGASIFRQFENMVTLDAEENGALVFDTYDDNFDKIASSSVEMVVTSQSKSGNVKCLFIGSSITARGTYVNRLKILCGAGFEAVGTRHASDYLDEYFEAVGGWGLSTFANYRTTKGNATSPFWHPASGRYWGVVGFWKDVMTYNEFDNSNPNNYTQSGRKTAATAAGFGADGYISGPRLQNGDIMYDDALGSFVQYNSASQTWGQISTPASWGFDFVKYAQMWDIAAPDVFVMGELSTNDFRTSAQTPNFSTWNTNAENMITALKAWKADIHIVMLIPISTFGLNYVDGTEFFARSSYRMYQSRLNQIENFDNREDENIYLVDDAIVFDEIYGYALSTNVDLIKPNQEYDGVESLRVQKNSPHSSTEGDYLLADGIFGIIQYLR